MSVRRQRTACLAPVVAAMIGVVCGQGTATAQQLAPGQSTGCPLSPGEYERAGYTIRELSVHNVFNWFRAVDHLTDRSQVDFPGENTPFRVSQANRAANALNERLHGRPEENTSPIVVTVVVNYIDNCVDANGIRQLDLVYTTLTNRLPLATGLTFESRQAVNDDAPAAVGAIAQPRVSLRATPHLAYTASDRLQVGGQVAVHAPLGLFDTLAGDAWGSSTSHLFRGSLEGAYDGAGPIAHSTWRLSGSDVERPIGSTGLLERRIMGQTSAQTRPVGANGVVFRFGASVESGHDDASDEQPLVVPGSLINTRYGAARVYGGASLNLPRHVLTGSYGFMLGSVPDGPRIDYRKSLVDAAYAFRSNVGDHRTLEVETRATAGWLTAPGLVPVAERFFGGNVAQDFIEGDAWRIRAAPMIRSFPNGTLNRTTPGSPTGGDNFFSLNVTVAVPAWRVPLVPSTISSIPEFANALSSAKGTARETTSAYYRSKDPAQKLVVDEAAKVTAALDRLAKRLEQLERGAPAGVKARLADCSEAVDEAQGNMGHLEDTGYGPIASSIVPDLLRTCRDAPGTDLQDPTVTAEYAQLTASATAVAEKLRQIDEKTITRKVDEDLGFAFRALDTLIHEVNGISIGPMFIVDAARIGPQKESAGGVRYGIGGGVRVSIMNVMNISAGYAKNPSPRAWESPGALFVSLDFVDLFR